VIDHHPARSGASTDPDYKVVGRRPTPRDGFPIVGSVDRVPGLYVAVMRSGVTPASAIGGFVADELLTEDATICWRRTAGR
jgi:glycine/D-amino acid oxidase-like deaminating enzyme